MKTNFITNPGFWIWISVYSVVVVSNSPSRKKGPGAGNLSTKCKGERILSWHQNLVGVEMEILVSPFVSRNV